MTDYHLASSFSLIDKTKEIKMTSFFFEIGLFAGKFFIIIIAVIIVMTFLGIAIAGQKKMKKKKTLEVTDMGEELQNYSLKMKLYTHSAKQVKKELKNLKKKKKKEKKEDSSDEQQHAYVLDFKGDIEASQVNLLREEISILLKTADPKTDEVILRLNNRGGAVYAHGLGASQLQRLKDKGFQLTICVDEIAGSGGYLMACVAHKILAAPFAILGSIGVLTQIPNFHRFLQKQNVDFEEHHAGKYKRTVTMFGEATEEKREKLREQLKEIHTHFKNYVAQHRPKLDMEKVATGDHWLGIKAKELGLVDEISTSDDYILSLLDNKKVYHICLKQKEAGGLQKLLKKSAQITEDFLKKQWAKMISPT